MLLWTPSGLLIGFLLTHRHQVVNRKRKCDILLVRFGKYIGPIVLLILVMPNLLEPENEWQLHVFIFHLELFVFFFFFVNLNFLFNILFGSKAEEFSHKSYFSSKQSPKEHGGSGLHHPWQRSARAHTYSTPNTKWRENKKWGYQRYFWKIVRVWR